MRVCVEVVGHIDLVLKQEVPPRYLIVVGPMIADLLLGRALSDRVISRQDRRTRPDALTPSVVTLFPLKLLVRRVLAVLVVAIFCVVHDLPPSLFGALWTYYSIIGNKRAITSISV